MKFLKSFCRWCARFLIGLVFFYFFVTLVIVPLALPWAVCAQGTKFLKVPVKLNSAGFNPFLLRLTLKGFEVKGPLNNTLISFDRLSVDVSFLNLLKKVYRVESIDLDGFFVHASLLNNGHIDLLDLIPQTPEASSTTSLKSPPLPPAPLPLFFVDRVVVQNGRIQFEDCSVEPVFKTLLSDIDITIQNFSTQPKASTTISFKAFLDDQGIVKAGAQFKPFMQPLDLDLNFGLNHYALKALSPYVGKYTGRNLAGGKLDFSTTYRLSGNQLSASHQILIQRFTFGEKVKSKDALNLPFGLVVALLEDAEGRIDISLPVKGDLSNPKFKYTHLIWQTAHNFFVKLTTAPFSILGSLLGSQTSSQELGVVKFLPAQAELSPQEQEKMVVLAKALKQRPKVLLEISGSYDLTLDWKSIKTENFLKEYNELHKESSRSEYWILQTLYQRHYGVRKLWKLTKRFKIKGGYDYEKLNPEIRRQLSEDAFPDKKALNELASLRAKVVYEALLKEQLDPRRVRIINNQEQQASLGLVPLSLTLTVYDKPSDADAADLSAGIDQATIPEEKI